MLIRNESGSLFVAQGVRVMHAYMGGATDFKVGVQNRIRERSERKKNLYPHLSKCVGYKQANISRGLLNILKYAVWLSGSGSGSG